jgi:hypothetical protein
MNDNDKPLVGFPGVDYSVPFRRGCEEFELEDGSTLVWPRCEISGCEAGVCIGMSKSLCYPHGIEFGAFTEAEFEANRAAKFQSP